MHRQGREERQLPGAYRRSGKVSSSDTSGFLRNEYPPKPSRYSSSGPTDNDFGPPDHFIFSSSDTTGSGSRNPSSALPGRQNSGTTTTSYPSHASNTSFASSSGPMPAISEEERDRKRTISMGANHHELSKRYAYDNAVENSSSPQSIVDSNHRGGKYRKGIRPPPYHTLNNTAKQATSDDQHQLGSDGSSVYSSAESFDSNEEFNHGYPPRPPKPEKYLHAETASSSNFTGQFYPDPLESGDWQRLQSGFTDDTGTTLTNGTGNPPDLEELAEYFNKRLDAVQRKADSAVNELSKKKKQGDLLTSDDSSFGQREIRPSNRAAAISSISSDASTITPTNSRLETATSTDGGLSAVRDEIDNLKQQITRGLNHVGASGVNSARDMDAMADYFSKRLEECQRQVNDAVSKVQSDVGELKRGFGPPPVRSHHGPDIDGRNGEVYYDSSDSGIGPRNLTIRPQTRARSDLKPSVPSTVTSERSSYPSVPAPYNPRHYKEPALPPDPPGNYPYTPPLPPPFDTAESIRTKDSTVITEKFIPPPPRIYRKPSYRPEKRNIMLDDEEDYLLLGSDAEDDWDDFEEFIDDDTPAPETGIPVPRIKFKDHNYWYQALYVIYIATFLAYVYVRIQYTLDAPGLNRVYCIVVAILEIVTAPSLLLQGLCLWRWISRPPSPPDALERIRFHTARIMVPTYKEPLEVVAGTVHEIIHMELPPEFHIHVYVLDDGKREILENWVLSKRTKRRVFLHYVARPKLPGVPHHAKAGNINHTLHYIFDDAYAEKECVIIFDADFMPRRNYLLRVLPVFSEKRTRPLALVQTPQFFYNVNPDEDVWDHLNVSFFHRIEPSLDRWSAVNCCGTNFVVRADALKDVGYFPVGCLTEDTLLSLRLCTMGWGVAYHHEVLAIGQSPHEITEIFKQRSRWCKGNLQIFLDEFPLMQSGLSLSQRIFYSSCGFNYFCASISIPFFQLVPAWAIFFGLWPVSKIGLEFAFAFFTYYLVGNLLLLFPPPGFGIKDMWNGELASTNLWFTYFNGVRRIVGTKLLKGKGELTFKTTKKKTEEDDDASKVGFQKEDVRACYMHFIMFFIMVVTIIYAILRAITATDVKFYFYYMYMIGMSWALINMTPYLIVVIYCWYRVRIPGLVVACFRNVQLLLRLVCIALIMVQAFTTRNMTENFVCLHPYTGQLGSSPLAMVKTLDLRSGLEVSRNAFWLLGLKDDFYTIQQIKQTACEEDEIPIMVIMMHPSQGLALDPLAGHYMPEHRIDTWEEYDEKLQQIAEHLSEVPSLIVMEPALLMHTFNSNDRYHNADYQIAFAQRVEMATKLFPHSWVYVDAGNAMYLQWNVNLKHIVDVLKAMPAGVRGFSINVGSFVNSTFNEELADEIHCRTGLHFLIDTSRNGGEFSLRDLDEINECTYDPPNVRNGSLPMWKDGSAVRKRISAGVGKMPTSDLTVTTAVPDYRERRWAFDENQYDPVVEPGNPAAGGELPGAGAVEGGDSFDYESYYPTEIEAMSSAVCVSSEGSGLDAYAWVKTPGEADGRLFPSGTYHPCLQGHNQDCSDTCPQYVPKIAGDFQRSESCECGQD